MVLHVPSLSFQTSSRSRQNQNNLWHSMASAPLPCPAHWDSDLHAPTHTHAHACEHTPCFHLQKPPASIEWSWDGCWLRKSSLPPSISLSSINIWSKRDLCSYLRDSWIRLVWSVYRNSNVQSVWAKDYWNLACTALPETQVARGWRRD